MQSVIRDKDPLKTFFNCLDVHCGAISCSNYVLYLVNLIHSVKKLKNYQNNDSVCFENNQRDYDFVK